MGEAATVVGSENETVSDATQNSERTCITRGSVAFDGHGHVSLNGGHIECGVQRDLASRSLTVFAQITRVESLRMDQSTGVVLALESPSGMSWKLCVRAAESSFLSSSYI